MNTVLIYAEDEPMRDAIKGMLCNHVPLIINEDLPQCLETLKQKAPISKAIVGISGMGEIDITQTIHNMLNIKPDLKIIAIGKKDSEEIAIEAVRQGADGYLLMPINAEKLLTTVR